MVICPLLTGTALPSITRNLQLVGTPNDEKWCLARNDELIWVVKEKEHTYIYIFFSSVRSYYQTVCENGNIPNSHTAVVPFFSHLHSLFILLTFAPFWKMRKQKHGDMTHDPWPRISVCWWSQFWIGYGRDTWQPKQTHIIFHRISRENPW